MAGPWEKYRTGPQQVVAPNPLKVQGAREDIKGKELENTLKQKELDKPVMLGDSGYMYDPVAKKAVPVPGLPPKPKPGALTNAQRIEISGDRAVLESLSDLLRQQEGLYRKNFRGTNLGEMVPGIFGAQNLVPSNQEYNSLGLQMRPLIAKALGFSAKQMDTPAELKNLDSYIPQSTDYDRTAEMKFNRLRTLIDKQLSSKATFLGQRKAPPKAPSRRSQSRVRIIGDAD